MVVAMYHYVRDLENSRYPNIKGLKTTQFVEQLAFLQNKGFEFVGLDTVVHEPEKLKEKSCLLTFDDGYLEHYTTVFPLLDKLGIEGFFSMPGKIIRERKVLDVNKIHFILASAEIEEIKAQLFHWMDYYRGGEFDYPPNQELYKEIAIANRFDTEDVVFVKRTLQVELPEVLRNTITDKLFRHFVTDNEGAFVSELYMDMNQVRSMKKHGMTFGFHGYEHYWLNRLDQKELELDIQQGLDVFSGVLDLKDWCCCYPYGSYSDSVIETLRNYGCTSGLSTDVDAYRGEIELLYKIPRLDTNDFPPKSEKFLEFVDLSTGG